MTKLILSFLGTPAVHHGEQKLSFSTLKTMSLFIYLVVEGGVQSRKKLAALLWPESDTKRGRRSLRRALASLRGALEESELLDPGHILADRNTIAFNHNSDFELDIDRLESASLIAQTTSSSNADMDSEYAPQLRHIVELYRGDFLEGFSLSDAPDFDNWTTIQRELYHQKMSLIFNHLSQLTWDRGELPEAIQTCVKWVGHDSLDEDAHRRLMQLQFAAGSRVAALQTYETYRGNLEKELGIPPTPETEALAERFRTEIPLAQSQDQLRTMVQTHQKEFVSPFVGRNSEHNDLVQLYLRAQRGEAQAVIVEGESGIGKTRLVIEFMNWASAQGADVLSGQAFHTAGGLPYQPIVESLRGCSLFEADPSNYVSDVWLGELSRLLPELRDVFPSLPEPLADDSTARTRLFEAVARLGDALSANLPVVLFIDDVQWADVGTLDMLQYLARRWVKQPILLIISIRSEALATSSALPEWLSDLGSAMPTARVMLGPLSPEDTYHLVQFLDEEIAHQKRHDEDESVRTFGELLYSETQGHPFYLMEVLKALLVEGVMKRTSTGQGTFIIDFDKALHDQARLLLSIPRSVRELIQARLTKLSPRASELLTAGAVLGRQFNLHLLCQVAAQEEEGEGLKSLEELLTNYLLREHQAGEKNSAELSYSFSHDKVLEVAYDEAGEARRRIYHRRAREALGAVNTPSAELARHAMAAGMSDQAFHDSVAAGDEALSLYAVSDAILHYSRSLEFSKRDQVAEDEPSKIRHLYTNFGRALELTDRHDAAFDLYKEMEASAMDRKDKKLELASLVAQATLSSTPGPIHDPSEGQVLSERALSLAEELNDQQAKAKTLWNLLLLNVFLDRPEDAVIYGERSIKIAREHNLREQLSYSLNDIYRAYQGIGELERAIEALDEARDLWRELANLPMLADNLINSAISHFFDGNYDRALTLLEEGQRIAESIENLWGRSFSKGIEGLVLVELGDFEQALGAIDECVQVAKEFGWALVVACFGAELAWLYARLGDDKHSIEHAENALKVLASSQIPPQFRSWALALLARVEILQGDLECASETLRKSYVGFKTNDYSSPRLGLVPIADAELAIATGDHHHAITVADELIDNLRVSGAQTFLPEALLLKARALKALHKNREARELLTEASDEAESLRARRIHWQILIDLAELEAEIGDQVKAGEFRARGIEIIESLADQIGSQEMRALFLESPLARAALGT